MRYEQLIDLFDIIHMMPLGDAARAVLMKTCTRVQLDETISRP
jgi:hypothetical protein